MRLGCSFLCTGKGGENDLETQIHVYKSYIRNGKYKEYESAVRREFPFLQKPLIWN